MDGRACGGVPALVGRDGELALLDSAVVRLTTGIGGAIVIEGDAGIGKSALLAHAARIAVDAGADVRRAGGDEWAQRRPFGVVQALFGPWAEAEPLGDVAVMAKLEDRRRRLVVDGEPVATGIVAVGDAWACTNPSLGRGAALGLLHACALRDLLREIAPSDRRGFALRWQEVTDATVGPWYDATVAYDRNRLADMRAARTGATRDADPVWETTKALQKAAAVDPDALRAFVSVVSVQELPMPAMTSVPDLFERVGRLASGIGEPADFRNAWPRELAERCQTPSRTTRAPVATHGVGHRVAQHSVSGGRAD